MSTKKKSGSDERFSHKIAMRLRITAPKKSSAQKNIAAIWRSVQALLAEEKNISQTAAAITKEYLVYFDTEEQIQRARQALEQVHQCRIDLCENEILHIHKGGKIAVVPRVRVDSIRDLRMIYTPGVAQVCKHIVTHPKDALAYTSIGNTVCIATNGSAILGLGNIGVLAGMPVMEGKSVIVQKMAQANCIPLLIESADGPEIVNALALLSKTFSLIMIEDIAAPVCFYVEDELQKRLSVPVFHDDQHGTATVVLAALIKLLALTRKRKEHVTIVINGAGAAGIATARLLLDYGFKNITLCDKTGALYPQRSDSMNPYKTQIAGLTNPEGNKRGSLRDVLKGADIFIGLSGPHLVTKEMIESMNRSAVVLALANPVPEIWPEEALQAGALYALDGRMVNNALAFPGIIRGALDSRAPRITTAMKFKAAEAIAAATGKKDVVPDFMDPLLHKRVALAVRSAV